MSDQRYHFYFNHDSCSNDPNNLNNNNDNNNKNKLIN